MPGRVLFYMHRGAKGNIAAMLYAPPRGEQEDKEDEDYMPMAGSNCDGLPHISMTLADIFENSEWGSGN